MRYYLSIWPVRLKKAITNLNWDSRSPGRDSNMGPTKYEDVLTNQRRRSIRQSGTKKIQEL
jgi:hypothetical protein